MNVPRHDLLDEILEVQRLIREYEPSPDLPDNLARLGRDTLKYRLRELLVRFVDQALDT